KLISKEIPRLEIEGALLEIEIKEEGKSKTKRATPKKQATAEKAEKKSTPQRTPKKQVEEKIIDDIQVEGWGGHVPAFLMRPVKS
ncbi:MAG: hypothetical protein QGH63_05090, partial [Rhodospirillales bacterium]|nr:hypothetical protein [Rhodospirillales bacterium]